ncbi:hypothetical protein HGM15179_021906, partial [Zosterops borbonicus]
NVTTEVISALTQDVNSLRHVVLQNRVAIDFLLLAQGHGCSEFKEMCCFNLSDHSQSIHAQLDWLKRHTTNTKLSKNPLDDWLTQTFSLTPWLTQLVKEGLRFLLMILIVILCVRLLFACFFHR